MLKVENWYETQEGHFVQILGRDEALDKFVGQLDARLICYDQEGQPYYIATGYANAPDIYKLKSLEPVSPPQVHEYKLNISISASIKVKGISIQEAKALAPDMIDLEALDKDLQIETFSIKIEDGHWHYL
ncbi:hypothetical protein [Ktedonospora formicarum]|uniref:Uncharacterized protein n=1 Tax=Ktedonospora formicarum TaxID=2778364 RepID=A0A8J3I834_9CHLR|nr:hypothetical protein [Ktedonospora formicarum]GHO47104.1 hypothetical protein KSX_52670 [Ktedonospora formicarum]